MEHDGIPVGITVILSAAVLGAIIFAGLVVAAAIMM